MSNIKSRLAARAASYDQDANQKFNDERAKDLGSDRGPTMKIENGVNVFWVTPSFGNGKGATLNTAPYAHMMIHYRPFHRCLRHDPVEKRDGTVKQDGNFQNCPRCITAWNHYDEGGRKSGPPKLLEKFKSDMSSPQVIFCVLNLSCFFKRREGGEAGVMVDPDKFKFFKDYLNIVDAVTKRESYTFPEDMPEDVRNAASLGFAPLKVSSELGTKIVSAFKESITDMRDKEKDKAHENDREPDFSMCDPTLNPDRHLLYVIRHPPAKASSAEAAKFSYNIKFQPINARLGWEFDEAMMESWIHGVENNTILDIHHPHLFQFPTDNPTFEERAYALQKFSPDELDAYLKHTKHSYLPEDEKADSRDDRQSSGSGSNSPDDFGDDDDDDGGGIAEAAVNASAKDRIANMSKNLKKRPRDVEDDEIPF